MNEIKESPQGVSNEKPTTERTKPENVVPNEEFEKRRIEIETRKINENPDLTIADLYDLLQSEDLSKERLDKMNFITDNERVLLKIAADLLWGLREKDKVVDELREIIKKLKQEYEKRNI